jgi:hypothetical protein
MIDESIATDYSGSSSFAYPEHMGDPEKMDKSFYLAYCKAFFSEYVRNQTSLPYSFNDGERSFSELRAYARGKNTPDKYKKLICGHDAKGNLNKTYMNISWAVPQVLPKFRDVIKGIAMSIDFDVNAIATDPSSLAQKEKEKAYYKIQQSKVFKEFKKQAQALGVPVEQVDVNFESERQVDLFFEAGGFKLAVEIATIACITQSKYLSDMDTIKEQVIEDLIDLGIGVMCDEINANGQIRARYVDPEAFFCAYSAYSDHRNIDRCAELKLYKLRELRELTELTEEELKNITKKYAENYGNTAIAMATGGIYNTNRRDQFSGVDNYSRTNDFRVPVMNVCFIASEIETMTKVKNKNTGATVINRVPSDYKLSKRGEKDGKVIVQNKVEYVYEAKWIPGTNVVFDYGKAKYIPRKNQLGVMEVRLPYHVYKSGTASIVDRCIPYVDDIAIATYKIRNSIASIPPAPRMVIDKAVLENLVLGGQKLTPKEALNLFEQKGTLFIQSLSDHGDQVTGSTNRPIDFLPSGISEDLAAFRGEIDNGINMIRNVTGVNELVDGSTPPNRTAVGVAQMASGATNNTLKPLFKGYEVLYQRLCTNWVLRWQLLVKSQGYKGQVMSIGEENAKVIELSKDFCMSEIGIFIKPAMTAVEKNELLEQIAQLRNVNMSSGGQGGIAPDAYLMLRQAIVSGNIPMAQKLIAEAIDYQRRKDQEREKERIEYNAQVQQQSAMVAAQEERKTDQIKHANKMQEMAMDAYLQAQLIQEEKDIDNAIQKINALYPTQPSGNEPVPMQ